MKVKEMNKQERPREKVLKQGIAYLSNRDLLAILLRSGTKDKSVLELADEILHLKGDLLSLMDLQLEDLMRIKGVKIAKATQLLACFELLKRMSQERIQQHGQLEGKPMIISEWLMNFIGHEEQEHFVVIFLNNRGIMTSYKDLFIGTGSSSYANPREIFLAALQHGCSKIICAHNHPSGNVTPSKADLFNASQLEQCGIMLGLAVVDHLIVSKYTYYSFREHFQMLDQKPLLQNDLFSDVINPQAENEPTFPQ